jgi:hypothetical protein
MRTLWDSQSKDRRRAILSIIQTRAERRVNFNPEGSETCWVAPEIPYKDSLEDLGDYEDDLPPDLRKSSVFLSTSQAKIGNNNTSRRPPATRDHNRPPRAPQSKTSDRNEDSGEGIYTLLWKPNENREEECSMQYCLSWGTFCAELGMESEDPFMYYTVPGSAECILNVASEYDEMMERVKAGGGIVVVRVKDAAEFESPR